MSCELLESILPQPFNHKIIKFSHLNETGGFQALLRVDIKSEDDVEKWRSEFQRMSGTDYIVGHTFPNVERLQYKKEFVCCRSKKHKKPMENDNRRSSIKLNAECKSKILIKIKLDTVKTRRTDCLVKEGLLGVVEIVWCHSHTVGAENIDSLAKSRTLKSTKEAFTLYFEAGDGPSQAKLHHQAVLQSQSDFNPAITLANASVNPKDRAIQHMHDKWLTESHGARSGADMIEKLREKIEDLKGEGVKIALSEFPFAVAIVTPIANRAHRHEMSKYIVFVDSTASCDLAGHSITFLLTASPAGALPLGALITSSQGQESYATGFKLLRGLLGCESFGGQGYPGVFMTDDSNAERGGLKEAWPESDQLLCQFHGPQAMWKWLWLGTHKIDNKDRQPLMQLYHDIMYAMDNESATTAYAKAMSTADVMGYPQFCHHLHSLWDSTDTVTQQPKRYLWCKAYRKGMTVGNETNNYAESNIRIFKDIILSRLKGYNPIALILLFCGKYEQYPVNEPATSRRLPDKSRSSKPAKKGRPPTSVVVCGATQSAAGKFPNGLARKRVLKCKRNLGDSIKKNRTNAKKHGENH